jgi:hypothetical protein
MLMVQEDGLYHQRRDAASPNVSYEVMFITAMVDVLEARIVAIVDLPGAFIQVDTNTLVLVRFVGKMVELLLEIDFLYEPNVARKKGERVLCFKLYKALYGNIREARLFYEKVTQRL